jgi:hypothetical protein
MFIQNSSSRRKQTHDDSNLKQILKNKNDIETSSFNYSHFNITLSIRYSLSFSEKFQEMYSTMSATSSQFDSNHFSFDVISFSNIFCKCPTKN